MDDLAFADFGGGVWDALASGPRARPQREAIEQAIAPIWEANHVWLILVVTVLFTAFPSAFAAVMTALHIPLTAVLLGVVLRGSAFVFRKYDVPDDAVHRRWSGVFGRRQHADPVLPRAVARRCHVRRHPCGGRAGDDGLLRGVDEPLRSASACSRRRCSPSWPPST